MEITSHAETREKRRESDVRYHFLVGACQSVRFVVRGVGAAGQCLDVVLVTISYSTSVPTGDTQSTTFLRPFNANLAVVSLIEHLAEKEEEIGTLIT